MPRKTSGDYTKNSPVLWDGGGEAGFTELRTPFNLSTPYWSIHIKPPWHIKKSIVIGSPVISFSFEPSSRTTAPFVAGSQIMLVAVYAISAFCIPFFVYLCIRQLREIGEELQALRKERLLESKRNAHPPLAEPGQETGQTPP
jgi:hypothetical protein